MAPGSGAPQLAQYRPVAGLPHDGQATRGSDEAEEGAVMCSKLVRRHSRATVGDYSKWGTTTEDYLPGALGVPAFGYGLQLDVFEKSRPQPSAVKPTAPGR
jgi:hypothetical protein